MQLNKKINSFFLIFCFCWIFQQSFSQDIVLTKGNFHLISNDSSPAVDLAIQALKKDFQQVMGFVPDVKNYFTKDPSIIIINEEKLNKPCEGLKSLGGEESHRICADAANNVIYLHGKDKRGTIYAIYTFSEKILGVPPLWYWSSWKPKEQKDQITIAGDLDIFYPSPQVKFRAWFPNSQDMLTKWRNLNNTNKCAYYETMLRLKLNTVEAGAAFDPSRKSGLSSDCERIDQYGLIYSSTHTVALHTHLSRWDNFWTLIKKETPPALTLANEEKLIEYWRYGAQVVQNSGIETIWNIAFRGNTDAPFWDTFKDAPKTDLERAQVINKMLNIQYNMIKEITGNENPFVKITFYDEISDFLGNGSLQPPAGENILWTYTAARRDHFPNVDIVNFNPVKKVKLGYYFNLQFVSTGCHLTQGEGPWKAEFNYRYANTKSPLCFSVINTGNIREELMSLSANAAMLWDMEKYNTDSFLLNFCEQYFGKNHAAEIKQLYRDYFYAYWEQRPSAFPGLERQYIFQDLRYSRIIRLICSKFSPYTDNPLEDIGFEREEGRTYNIDSDNQVEALLSALPGTAEKFMTVANKISVTKSGLDEQTQLFFNDNLRTQAYFMSYLNTCVYHLIYAYKYQSNKDVCLQHLELSLQAMEKSQTALYEAQHGIFDTWYSGDKDGGYFNMDRAINSIAGLIDTIKKK